MLGCMRLCCCCRIALADLGVGGIGTGQEVNKRSNKRFSGPRLPWWLNML